MPGPAARCRPGAGRPRARHRREGRGSAMVSGYLTTGHHGLRSGGRTGRGGRRVDTQDAIGALGDPGLCEVARARLAAQGRAAVGPLIRALLTTDSVRVRARIGGLLNRDIGPDLASFLKGRWGCRGEAVPDHVRCVLGPRSGPYDVLLGQSATVVLTVPHGTSRLPRRAARSAWSSRTSCDVRLACAVPGLEGRIRSHASTINLGCLCPHHCSKVRTPL